MRGLVAVVVACAGCDTLLDLKPTLSVDAAPDAAFSICDPLPFDPLRYLTPNTSAALSVTTARQVCAALGFELVSFDANDPIEQTNELFGAHVPYWTGLSFASGAWTNPDGCPPWLPWRVGEPSVEDATSCGLITVDSMVSLSCGFTMDGSSGPIAALCETARPSPACRLHEGHSTYRVASTGPVANGLPDAVAACNGPNEHVVEIDSGAELAAVSQLAGSMGAVPFWLDPQLTNGMWTTPTGCPAVFAWAANEPNTANGSCVMNDADGMHVRACRDNLSYAICEANP